ncbi:DUF6804 family protein [Microbacterium sp. CH12i]|uniref:DUF6804 family protein n=1 Tax=Microbacterium sp. CH12i TaxID=1479651 RepID=UPI0012690476|nr:DUF6804 family protein [Microbacterium sp. CH12i]
MTSSAPQMQRNALAPGLLAAIALFLSPLFTQGLVATIILYVVAILAVIVAWFAWQAGQWWWTIVFVAVAVIWNPVFPFGFSGVVWTVAQFVAAVAFLAAAALIKNDPR